MGITVFIPQGAGIFNIINFNGKEHFKGIPE
jgi:hypothetical protein